MLVTETETLMCFW